MRAPSLFSITFAVLPSMTATQEFVVPRSMPMTFAMATSCCSRAAQPEEALRPTPLDWSVSQGIPLRRAGLIYERR